MPTPSPTPTPGTRTITILGMRGNLSYSPNPMNVSVGTTVRFFNADSVVHTATQNQGLFDTSLLAPGSTSAPITLTTAGSFGFHCARHPSMVGTINVTP